MNNPGLAHSGPPRPLAHQTPAALHRHQPSGSGRIGPGGGGNPTYTKRAATAPNRSGRPSVSSDKVTIVLLINFELIKVLRARQSSPAAHNENMKRLQANLNFLDALANEPNTAKQLPDIVSAPPEVPQLADLYRHLKATAAAQPSPQAGSATSLAHLQLGQAGQQADQALQTAQPAQPAPAAQAAEAARAAQAAKNTQNAQPRMDLFGLDDLSPAGEHSSWLPR